MNILQINSVCGIGSTGRIATDLHGILESRGHQSTVAFGRGDAQNCASTIRIGSRTDNYLHALQTRLFDAHGFGSKKATAAFITKIEKLNPDLIHLHNLHGYYLHVGLLMEYLKQIKKPIVWTLHDCWAFTGHCVHFDYIGCDRWKSSCHDCPMKMEYPRSLVFDRSRKNFEIKRKLFTGLSGLTFVTPSRWLGGLLKDSFLKEYPATVINNGIDLAMFKPQSENFRTKHKLNGQFLILGVTSIWDERKGFNYFLDLAKELRDNEKIIMVGLNPHQMKGLPPGMIGIAQTNSIQELAEIYSAADVFVNPTLEDNFPTTNLEALACGTPVITFNSGGSPESVNAECGLIVERGNMAELVASVAKVRKIGKISYSERCRERVIDFYDKNKNFNNYIEIFFKLISDTNSERIIH